MYLVFLRSCIILKKKWVSNILDLGIVSRFCEIIRTMCEKGNVRKSSTTNTDFLADSINVDVLIKINHINFIGGKIC